jgi:hypothetical protein
MPMLQGKKMNWTSVEDFAKWYKINKFPIRPPQEDPVYVTEISMSYVLFREGQYQAELYLVKPNTGSPDHSHPGVENIITLWGGDIGLRANGIDYGMMLNAPLFGMQCDPIRNGSTHALECGPRGGAFLSLEKWDDGLKPTSVTIRWHGDTCGDTHTGLVDIS